MLRHLFGISREVADLVPHSAVRIESQAANLNPGHKIARGDKKLLHQDLIFGEEQNITHKPSHSFPGRKLIDSILRTLLQKKKRRDGGAEIIPRSRQASAERR